MTAKDRRFHIWTVGCQMNTADSQHVADALTDLGYSLTRDPDEAEIVVLNTCVVRQSAENKAVGKLGALKGWKLAQPDRTLALMGCMVGVNPPPALVQRFPHVDVFMPPSEPLPLVNHLLQDSINRDAESLIRDLTSAQHAVQNDEVRDVPGRTLGDGLHHEGVTAYVPVVYGCSHACTFCIIPFRRGVERSRSLDDIRSEVELRVGQGAREVTLLGQIVDRYGYDLRGPLGHSAQVPVHGGLADSPAPDLADLLHAIHDIPGLWRIRFLTSHPTYLSDRILDAVRDLPKVCEQIEVPAQAGNNDVLRNMRRGYTQEEYRDLIGHVRSKLPDCSIHTDIIVGFCGETDGQFQDTEALLRDLEPDKAHLARYSPRPGTVSARRMEDDVPDAVKRDRHARLDALMRDVCLRKNRRQLGKRVELLIERRHKGRWLGRTRQNRLVFVDDDQDLTGRMVNARISWAGPWSMQGRLESILEGPSAC